MEPQIITNYSDKEIATLKAVDALGSATVSQIAKKAGLARTTVYNFIDKLSDSGLIVMHEIDGVRHYNSADKSVSLFEAKREGVARKFQDIQLLINRDAIRKVLHRGLVSDKNIWLVGSIDSINFLGKKFFERYILGAQNNDRLPAFVLSNKDAQKQSHLTDALSKFGVSFQTHDMPLNSTLIIAANKIVIISKSHGGVGYAIKDPGVVEAFLLLI